MSTRPTLRLVSLDGPTPLVPRPRDLPQPLPPPAPGRPAASQHLVERLGACILEVLQGRRRLRQLADLLDPDVLDVVRVWAQHGNWAGSRLASARATRLSATAVEGCVRVVLRDQSSVMLVLRLDARGPRWHGTRLEVLCSRAHRVSLGLEELAAAG